eukprot:4748-Heterococcus_DN1.PRE.2
MLLTSSSASAAAVLAVPHCFSTLSASTAAARGLCFTAVRLLPVLTAVAGRSLVSSDTGVRSANTLLVAPRTAAAATAAASEGGVLAVLRAAGVTRLTSEGVAGVRTAALALTEPVPLLTVIGVTVAAAVVAVLTDVVETAPAALLLTLAVTARFPVAAAAAAPSLPAHCALRTAAAAQRACLHSLLQWQGQRCERLGCHLCQSRWAQSQRQQAGANGSHEYDGCSSTPCRLVLHPASTHLPVLAHQLNLLLLLLLPLPCSLRH